MNKLPALVLVTFVVLPGFTAVGVCGYYTLRDWVALDAAFSKYQKLAAMPNISERELAIAAHAETRHRINCFADGVGVMLGGVIAAIGLHGIFVMPNRQ
jgi:hypothetical protein